MLTSLIILRNQNEKRYVCVKIKLCYIVYLVIKIYYYQVSQAKLKTYPANITVTEEKIEAPVEDVLNHTMIRLQEAENFKLKRRFKYELHCKFGFDSTNVKNFKQMAENKEKKFTNLFCTSLVPLRLINKCTEEVNTRQQVLKNKIMINNQIFFKY